MVDMGKAIVEYLTLIYHSDARPLYIKCSAIFDLVFLFCRAKYICAELQGAIDHVEEREKGYRGLENTGFHYTFYPIHQFPGYRDKGSPLIIEDEGGRKTIIGLFKEQLNENAKGPALFSKIHPNAFNWIVTYADGTEDSKCDSYTACSCGIEGKGNTDSFNNRFAATYV